MKYRTLLTLSLAFSFALAGAAQAAPPPRDGDSRGAQAMTKEQIQGRVESVQGQKAIVRTQSGRRVEVNLGPQSFWREKGYDLHPGTPIRVQGWHRENDDQGPFFAGGIWGPDFYFELTNNSGFPYWADQDDYWDGWSPTWDYYDAYYSGPAPYAYGPPPSWWWGPPPPPWWYRQHHFYGRPGFRWGWQHRFGPPHRSYGRGPVWHDRGRGDGRDGGHNDQQDHGNWNHGDRNDRGHNDGDHQDQRNGRRGH